MEANLKVNGDGSVYLEKGDKFPVFCGCGNVYQPNAAESFSSGCPKCRRRNIHSEQKFTKVDPN
jgi:hypothetical protein